MYAQTLTLLSLECWSIVMVRKLGLEMRGVMSSSGREVIKIRKLGGRVGRQSRRTLMRLWRDSGVPHSSSASRTIRTGWCTLVVIADNGFRRRVSNFVLRFDGPKTPVSFNWSTRDSATV